MWSLCKIEGAGLQKSRVFCETGEKEKWIFRGFLLQALKPEGEKQAIFISGLTFGVGHKEGEIHNIHK